MESDVHNQQSAADCKHYRGEPLVYTWGIEVPNKSQLGLRDDQAFLNRLFDASVSQFHRPTKVGARLRPYPIPEPLRDYTAYHVLRRGTRWKRIRRDFLSAAGHRCAACGVRRGILSCHGKWTYDDRLLTATLTNFVILCEDCAVATHIAQSIRRGFGSLAIRQLSRVNRLALADAEGLAREAMTTWKKRNKKSWRVYIAPDLLDRYPQLRELSSSRQGDKLQFPRKTLPYESPRVSRSSLSRTPAP
jgi:hypothetical protein